MKYLLDTDTIIYWSKNKNNIADKIDSIGLDDIVSSEINRVELYFGAFNSDRIEKNLKSVEVLSKLISFIPFNSEAQIIFAKNKANLKKKGTPVGDMDLMVASIAIANDLILVTNNTKHFQNIPDLKLENWAE